MALVARNPQQMYGGPTFEPIHVVTIHQNTHESSKSRKKNKRRQEVQNSGISCSRPDSGKVQASSAIKTQAKPESPVDLIEAGVSRAVLLKVHRERDTAKRERLQQELSEIEDYEEPAPTIMVKKVYGLKSAMHRKTKTHKSKENLEHGITRKKVNFDLDSNLIHNLPPPLSKKERKFLRQLELQAENIGTKTTVHKANCTSSSKAACGGS
eukprot:Colp12_sorted_trinity150504_noHs@9980